jgi:hypothetical protein
VATKKYRVKTAVIKAVQVDHVYYVEAGGDRYLINQNAFEALFEPAEVGSPHADSKGHPKE